MPLAIVCARIYYVAFQWEQYKDNPISVLYIWQGGIAIYGGVIGAIIGLLLFTKVRKQKLTPYLDLMGLGLLIGQCVGRWGNFFNREAHGAQILNRFFLRMGIEEVHGSGIFQYWHPTFLYESLWNFVGFFLLHFLSKKRKYDGQTFLRYVAWYGLGRVWIEGLRTDSLYIGDTGLRVSQLLAGASFILAVGVMLYIRLFKNPDGSRMLVNQAAEPVGAAIGRPPEAEASDEATGNGQQATEDEGCEVPEVEAVEALTERPPEAEASDEAAGNGQQATEDEKNDAAGGGALDAPLSDKD